MNIFRDNFTLKKRDHKLQIIESGIYKMVLNKNIIL